MVKKYYIRNWYVYADRGNISAISGKAHTDKGRVNTEVGNRKKYGKIVGVSEGKPKVWEMAQKLPVRPIE